MIALSQHPADTVDGMAVMALDRDRFAGFCHIETWDNQTFVSSSGLAIMKSNSDMGYRPVTFSELPGDDGFWKKCESCVNHDILVRTNRQYCLCTAMLFDPAKPRIPPTNHYQF